MSDFLLVIPARYKSKRLRGKPLATIGKLPMIVRTYNQCVKVVSKNKIIVATDSYKIKKVCDEYKIKSIITSNKCLTGTDRVAEVSKKIKCNFYINVQGDEPFFNPNDLRMLIKEAKKKPNEVINGYTEIKNKKLFFSSSIPKVIFDKNGYLLYMSRGPIPSNKALEFKKAWRQVCIYSLPKKALKIFSNLRKKTILESLEDCELMRFLELGLEVKMIKMSNNSISVDTKNDLKKIIKVLKRKS